MRTRHPFLFALAIASAFIAYFFVGAQSIDPELVATPVWMVTADMLAGLPAAETGDDCVGLRSGSLIAYFDRAGSLAGKAEVASNASLDDSRYALYDDEGSASELYGQDGASAFTIRETGFTHLDGGRIFHLKPTMTGFAEYSEAGNRILSFEANAVITCFDAIADKVILGTLDGKVIVIDSAGKEEFSFYPGGSRIEATVGVAFSPDGRRIAVMAGVDKQRIMVMERFSTEYRTIYHRPLVEDFRKPTRLAFSPDDRYVFYPTSSGFGVIDCERSVEFPVSLMGEGRTAYADVRRGFSLTSSYSNGFEHFVMSALPNTRLGSFDFPGGDVMVEVRDASVFLASAKGMARIDFTEN